MSDDPYVYPDTDVLRNMRGIRDRDELEEFEARLTFLRGLRLASDPIGGEYDLAHLQAFHRYLFADLYEWAGELRTVVLAKTDLFCLPEHIESYGAEIFGKLAEEDRLRGLDRGLFAQLASDAGYRVDWQFVDLQRNIDVSMATMQGDEVPMRNLLDEITRPIG